MRFDELKLRSTIHAFNSAVSHTDLAQTVGVPRYCIPALVAAGVLTAPDDPDVVRLFGEPAVTAYSFAALRTALEDRQDKLSTPAGLNSLGDHLRRRFDPTVWAQALRLTVERPRIRMAGWSDDNIRHQIIDWIYIMGHELYEELPEDDPSRIDRDVSLTAQEAGRLLGLPSAHLPELFKAQILPALKCGQVWRVTLGDVIDFHAQYVTSSELLQRSYSPLIESRDWLPHFEDYEGVLTTRHFRLCPRAELELELELELERDWEWPDTNLR